MDSPIQTDYPSFAFPGFSSEGRCYLRVLESNNKYVFVCAQLKNYYGTSITNAIEQIAKNAANKVLRPNIKEKELIKFIRNAVWIEYYPPGTGLSIKKLLKKS